MAESESLNATSAEVGVHGFVGVDEEFVEPANGLIRQRMIDLIEQAATGVPQELILQDIDVLQADIADAMKRGEFVLPRTPFLSGMSRSERLAQFLAHMATANTETALQEALVTIATSQRSDLQTHIESVTKSPGYRLVAPENSDLLPQLKIDQSKELVDRLFAAGRLSESDKALFDQIFDAKVAAVPAYATDASTPSASETPSVQVLTGEAEALAQ